jgi:hypothetical protein
MSGNVTNVLKCPTFRVIFSNNLIKKCDISPPPLGRSTRRLSAPHQSLLQPVWFSPLCLVARHFGLAATRSGARPPTLRFAWRLTDSRMPYPTGNHSIARIHGSRKAAETQSGWQEVQSMEAPPVSSLLRGLAPPREKSSIPKIRGSRRAAETRRKQPGPSASNICPCRVFSATQRLRVRNPGSAAAGSLPLTNLPADASEVRTKRVALNWSHL